MFLFYLGWPYLVQVNLVALFSPLFKSALFKSPYLSRFFPFGRVWGEAPRR